MPAPAAFAAASLSMPSLGAGIRLPPASSLCGRSSKARLLIYLPFLEHTSRQIVSLWSMLLSGFYCRHSAMSPESHACIAIVPGIRYSQTIWLDPS